MRDYKHKRRRPIQSREQPRTSHDLCVPCMRRACARGDAPLTSLPRCCLPRHSKSVMSAASVGLASIRMKRIASSRRNAKSVSPPRPPAVTKMAVVPEAPLGAGEDASPGRGSLSALLNMDVFGSDDDGSPGVLSPPLIRHGVRDKFETSGGTRVSVRRKASRMLLDSKKRAKCVRHHGATATAALLVATRVHAVPDPSLPVARGGQVKPFAHRQASSEAARVH